MLLNIDKSIRDSLFKQIVTQISSMIESGDLEEGFQMPSSRDLSSSIGVNRSTVIRAYEELWALGYLESTPGSYTRVRKRVIKRAPEQGNILNARFWEERFSGNYLPDFDKISEVSAMITKEREASISFEKLEPDSRLIDNQVVSRCFREAIHSYGGSIYGYCNPRGYAPLRNSLVSHMRLHCVNSTDENVLITNGTQNSLQLIFQAFIAKGDTIAIESPTYSMIIPLIKHFGCKILEIPVKEDGMDISALREQLKTHRIKMVYTIPTFHNPTSVTMPQSKREELMALCVENKIIIIEDSFEEEMKYFGKVHLPIKSMDSNGIVIYLGSFSKILAPGFRLGWVIADIECIKRLTSLKTIFDLSSNTINQVMLHHFCKGGYYEMHIRKLQRAYKIRMKIALKALKIYLPSKKASWSEPFGGFLIWIKLNIRNKEIDIEDHFRKFGVTLINGNRFFLSAPSEQYIRISISNCTDLEIVEGIKRIATAIENLD